MWRLCAEVVGTTKTKTLVCFVGTTLALGLMSVGAAANAAPFSSDLGCDTGRGCAAKNVAAKKARSEGVLEKVGLGSLEDIPWEAFPPALVLSALIGAAGGFVYAGIEGTTPQQRRRSGGRGRAPSS